MSISAGVQQRRLCVIHRGGTDAALGSDDLEARKGMVDYVLVENPHGDDLEFKGELVAEGRDHDVGIVKVWRTKGGRYVLKQNRSLRPGVTDIHRAAKFETIEELSEALGHSPGAKEVARKVGLRRATRID